MLIQDNDSYVSSRATKNVTLLVVLNNRSLFTLIACLTCGSKQLTVVSL